MSELQELFGVSREDALEFFLISLSEVLEGKKRSFRNDELFYVADILTRYSLEPIDEDGPYGNLKNNLTCFLDFFVLQGNTLGNPEVLEDGGSQVILFAGFFRDQMSRRYHLSYYEKVAQGLYIRASINSHKYQKREFLGRFAQRVPFWTRACCDLNKYCRERRYLIEID